MRLSPRYCIIELVFPLVCNLYLFTGVFLAQIAGQRFAQAAVEFSIYQMTNAHATPGRDLRYAATWKPRTLTRHHGFDQLEGRVLATLVIAIMLRRRARMLGHFNIVIKWLRLLLVRLPLVKAIIIHGDAIDCRRLVVE